MKRIPGLVLAAVLTLTACTDQPLPAEPETNVATGPAASKTPMTNDTIAASIAEILEQPDSDQLLVDRDALEALTDLLLPHDDKDAAECTTVTDPSPEVAAFGQATDANGDGAQDTQSLAAFGFTAEEQAADFTAQLQRFVQTCSALDSMVEPLTHHTHEAFEVQVDQAEESASFLVVLRDEDTVLVASSTPPSDVALSLTLADQLQGMLR